MCIGKGRQQVDTDARKACMGYVLYRTIVITFASQDPELSLYLACLWKKKNLLDAADNG